MARLKVGLRNIEWAPVDGRVPSYSYQAVYLRGDGSYYIQHRRRPVTVERVSPVTYRAPALKES